MGNDCELFIPVLNVAGVGHLLKHYARKRRYISAYNERRFFKQEPSRSTLMRNCILYLVREVKITLRQNFVQKMVKVLNHFLSTFRNITNIYDV